MTYSCKVQGLPSPRRYLQPIPRFDGYLPQRVKVPLYCASAHCCGVLHGATMKGNSSEDAPHENPSEQPVRQHKITARAIDRKSDLREERARLTCSVTNM